MSPRVPAEPARFGVMVAVQVPPGALVIATVHGATPASRTTTTGDVDSGSVLRAVSWKACPRTASATEASRRNASASTEVDWAARWVPFVAATTMR